MPSEPVERRDAIKIGRDFELNVEAYELRRSGRVIKLEPIPMAILMLLAERRGLLVTRDQIAEKIWGRDVFLDTDNSINGAISKIRQALRDDAEEPRFLQTVTGKGYRFVARMEEEPGPAPGQGGEKLPDDEIRAGRARSLTVGRRWPWLLGSSVLLAAIILYFFWPIPRERLLAPSHRLTLAVLPFVNLTGDPAQDYFSDGMTEEMISDLGRLDAQHLGVIARTSVMHYKQSSEPLKQIAHELAVQYVLEGSVRRDSNKVRITAQLIRMDDQTHVWAEQYDRNLSDLLSVQTDIAHEIAGQIQLVLVEPGRKDQTPQDILTPERYAAYDLYLKGRYALNKRTVEGLRQAITCFEEATVKDPTSARAYAGLADSYALLGPYSGIPQAEFMPKARAAALRALAIDEKVAEGHAAFALIVQNYDWDWQTAEKEYLRAIELDSNYATAHQWYAEHLAWRGRFDEALQESERARQLDPLSLIIASDNAAILYYSRQYDRSIQQLRALREVDRTLPRSGTLFYALLEKGMISEALTEVERVDAGREGPWGYAELGYVYGRSGRSSEARHALDELQDLNRHQPLDPVFFLVTYLGMGDKERAFACLGEAYSQKSNLLTTLKVDPLFDPLRGDPRFQDLERRAGLF